jgi:hypothetical protein
MAPKTIAAPRTRSDYGTTQISLPDAEPGQIDVGTKLTGEKLLVNVEAGAFKDLGPSGQSGYHFAAEVGYDFSARLMGRNDTDGARIGERGMLAQPGVKLTMDRTFEGENSRLAVDAGVFSMIYLQGKKREHAPLSAGLTQTGEFVVPENWHLDRIGDQIFAVPVGSSLFRTPDGKAYELPSGRDMTGISTNKPVSLDLGADIFRSDEMTYFQKGDEVFALDAAGTLWRRGEAKWSDVAQNQSIKELKQELKQLPVRIYRELQTLKDGEHAGKDLTEVELDGKRYALLPNQFLTICRDLPTPVVIEWSAPSHKLDPQALRVVHGKLQKRDYQWETTEPTQAMDPQPAKALQEAEKAAYEPAYASMKMRGFSTGFIFDLNDRNDARSIGARITPYTIDAHHASRFSRQGELTGRGADAWLSFTPASVDVGHFRVGANESAGRFNYAHAELGAAVGGKYLYFRTAGSFGASTLIGKSEAGQDRETVLTPGAEFSLSKIGTSKNPFSLKGSYGAFIPTSSRTQAVAGHVGTLSLRLEL